MRKFEELQTRHLELVARYEQGKESEDLLVDVRAYVAQVQLAGKEIGDSRERNQLRANLRFWGAYIYDHSGTYPNLNLLPSEGGTALTAAKPKPMNFRWIIIASIVLLVAIVMIGLKILFPPARASNPLELFTSPFPSSDNSMSMVEELATGTAEALTQSANQATATLVATSTPFAFFTPTIVSGCDGIPCTGGGSDLMIFGHVNSSTEIHDDVSCSNQRINIKMIHGLANDVSVEPATLTISEEGTFRTIAERQIPLQSSDSEENDNTEIETEIDIPDAKGSYLIYIDHPKFTFNSVIVQHLPDCRGNLTEITYDIPLQDFDALETRPYLGVKFNLIAWGPSPAIDMTSVYEGVAKIRVSDKENTNRYIFWKWSITSDGYEPLQNDDFISYSSAVYYIFITSGGQTVLVPFRLETPYVDYLRNE